MKKLVLLGSVLAATVTLASVAAALDTTGIGGPPTAGRLRGTVSCEGLRDNRDAVVWIEEVPGRTFEAPKESVVVDQKDMEFVPHVLPVLVGTTVEFLNSDAFLHNVFAPEKCADRFNLGSWASGQSRSYTFQRPCKATLLCRVHPEMEAFVVVVRTPFFAVTDESGSYVIDDVPEGRFVVKAWHPKLKETSLDVEVSGESTLDIVLSR